MFIAGNKEILTNILFFMSAPKTSKIAYAARMF